MSMREREVGEASVNLQFQRHVWAIYQELKTFKMCLLVGNAQRDLSSTGHKKISFFFI